MRKEGKERGERREKEKGIPFVPQKRIHATFEQHSPRKQPIFAKSLHLPFPGCL